MWCLGVNLGRTIAVATVGLPNSKRGMWYLGVNLGRTIAVATVGQPSSNGVCGVWMLTWVGPLQ